jgi:glucosamine--fructose-6-phosphate aminotransferase (isomerizing)
MALPFSTPLLAADSPLDRKSRELIQGLYEKEQEKALGLPSDEALDPKRRRRVDLTRPEIFEQPDAIRTTLAKERGAIAAAARAFAAGISRIYLVGCGDSLAVMVAARALFEQVLGVPAEPVQALDFAYYYHRPIDARTLVVTLSSSGATTRTVEAMLIARALGARTLALSNTAGSPLMTESDCALLIHAERKGWPTQASTAALALLIQFALDIARHQNAVGVDALQSALDAVPEQISAALDQHEPKIEAIAEREAERLVYLYAGGGPAYASALFGAAKVKECSPDHGIAIPLEEFHHYNSQKRGDPLFLIAPRGPSLPRARDTAAEGRRWGGTIYSILTEGETSLDGLSHRTIALPDVPEPLSPLVYTIPVQLFAYHVAMAKFRRAEVATRS